MQLNSIPFLFSIHPLHLGAFNPFTCKIILSELLLKLLDLQVQEVNSFQHENTQVLLRKTTNWCAVGSWQWFPWDYCLRTVIWKHLPSEDWLEEQPGEEVSLKRCHLSWQVACPEETCAEAALWWLMRPSGAVNSAICNHFSPRPFSNHFGKFFSNSTESGRRKWELSYFTFAGRDLDSHKLQGEGVVV